MSEQTTLDPKVVTKISAFTRVKKEVSEPTTLDPKVIKKISADSEMHCHNGLGAVLLQQH